jgi:hypothetical protein
MQLSVKQLAEKHVEWLLGLLGMLRVDKFSCDDLKILMIEEFVHGYKHGYDAGYEDAKREAEKSL